MYKDDVGKQPSDARDGTSPVDAPALPSPAVISGPRSAPSLFRTSVSPISDDRPVFTLSVAADLLGMHPRTLRIYEEEGLVVPARTSTKRRRYSQNDIKRFQFIQHLTQRLKVNLAGVRIILEMMNALEDCGVDFTQRLHEMSDQLAADGRRRDE
ncbi:MAG: MerR family transcriptional regulator [Chloroflexia bacterium]